MGLFSISEQKIQNHVQSAIAPGEQVQQIVLGTEKPFWTKVFSRIGYMFWKSYIVASTNHRVLFVEYGGLLSGFKAKKVDALGYHELDKTELGWGIFNKNLTFRGQARNFKKTVEVNRFQRKGNLAAAESVVGIVQQAKSLPPGPMHGQQPAQMYGQQQYQQAQYQLPS
ncbi:MAG: hypothetical protein U0174_27680 [Polyangiaceae bacterium]